MQRPACFKVSGFFGPATCWFQRRSSCPRKKGIPQVHDQSNGKAQLQGFEPLRNYTWNYLLFFSLQHLGAHTFSLDLLRTASPGAKAKRQSSRCTPGSPNITSSLPVSVTSPICSPPCNWSQRREKQAKGSMAENPDGDHRKTENFGGPDSSAEGAASAANTAKG